MTQLENDLEYVYYIESDSVQKGANNVFKHQRMSLTAGREITGTSKVIFWKERMETTPSMVKGRRHLKRS